MSSTQTRLPRTQAAELAWEIVSLLSPFCERIEVCGSIRRERPDCGDIELLAIPKVDAPVATDLFGNPLPIPPMNALHLTLDALMFDRTLVMREPKHWGHRYRAALYRGFPVDMYICLPPAQFGVLKVIRTGSAEFCKRLVTPVEQGGWCPQGMYFKGAQLWLIQTSGVHMALHTPEERQVFTAIGQPYLEPQDREV